MPTALNNGSRPQLAEFLRDRRRRLGPADVGLPYPSKRRASGLRREEVASLAGVGLTWYTWLEQGRDIQVSTSFLENLSRALRLTEAERAYLFLLAHHRAPPLARSHQGHVTAASIQPVLDTIGYPAYARTAWFDVLAWNAANTRIFGDFSAIAVARRNVLRLMFSVEAYRNTIVNWEADARGLLAKFRLAMAEWDCGPKFINLIRDLSEISPCFRRLWGEHFVDQTSEGVTHFNSSRNGTHSFQHYTLVPDTNPDLRIVVFLPLDDRPSPERS